MNGRVRALLRVQWLDTWRGFRDRYGSWWGLVLIFVLGRSIVQALGLLVLGYTAFYLAASRLGKRELLITVMVAAAQVVCLISGVFAVISAFYFGRDLPYLIPLPFRPGEIAVSKFFRILIHEYIIIAPLVAPGLAIYGRSADVSSTFLPFAVIIFLLIPAVPLALASVFSMVLMRTTNLRRNQEEPRVAAALIAVSAVVFFGQWAEGFGTFSVHSEQVAQVQ